jgi:hypothetical protein
MDIGSLLLALALLLLVAAFVARPLIEQVAHRNGASNDLPADDLIARRETVLVELRDLDFDHSTGKVSAADYQTQRARLVAQGADILRALDQFSSPQSPNPQRTLDDEIESLVAARRKGRAATPAPRGAAASHRLGSFCPQCGQPVVANDKFCAHCGAKISIAEAAR